MGGANRRVARAGVSILAVVVVFVLVWEGYKLIWTAMGWENPVRPDDRTMPHTWDILLALFQPAQRNGPPFILVELRAALMTLREAFVGFLIGGAVGFGIGVLFVRSTMAERAFTPYVVASQTVPIIAIAPMVVVWGGRMNLPQWLSVSLIAAYLTFFPVAINTLRGLRSPPPTSMELMRSYASSPGEILWKLQVPAAMPYIFTALKVSAAASVIGAIVGELPAGLRGGLGRDLLQFSQQFTAAPEKLFAAVLIAGLAGIAFVGLVTAAEHRWIGANRRLTA
ncbi:MAG TPA: ABC transporter permease [Acidimicrobiia bacterium]|jgi:NitT/TauT family transport system permease protein|nr:ABC transporter permease [Acidimicrobiia bacterium]